MSKCYKEPFLNKVIVKIDFTSNFNLPQKGLPKKISEEILKYFPIPEPREITAKHIHITNNGTSEKENKQNQLFFHGRNREKTLCITSEYLYIEVTKYTKYEEFRDIFLTLLNQLSEKEDFSIKRLGLRYINQIKINTGSPFEWNEYLNPNLLNIFNVPETKDYLSRVFSNLVQQFDDGMLLNFQYGMHNPDFPSKIRQKLFVLDYDAYIQGLIGLDEIKTYIDSGHKKIEELFEKSITQDLRDLMGEKPNE